jgi:hypothetical protein
MEDKKYPEGHFIGLWMSIGIAIFTGVGIPLSIATEIPALIGIGPALGVSIGLAIGSSMESKAKIEGKIRPRKQADNAKSGGWLIVGIGLLLLGIVLALFFWLKM